MYVCIHVLYSTPAKIALLTAYCITPAPQHHRYPARGGSVAACVHATSDSLRDIAGSTLEMLR